jgi:pyridoxine 4-dehydrogenase
MLYLYTNGMLSDSAGRVTIGGDITVCRLGLGTNRIHLNDISRDALKKAVSLGINFIDTASAYTNGESEEAIGETLSPYHGIVIATKGGMVPPDFHIDSRPESLEKSLKNSLKKLKLKSIPLYFLHRVDPNVPFKDALLFLKDMQQQGKIKHIGLSQVTIKEIEEARKYINVAAIENGYSMTERAYDDVVAYAEKEKIVFIPFFPLHIDESKLPHLVEIKNKYKATSAQIAIAWLLKKSPMILPIPGSLSANHLEENIEATKIQLSIEDFERL